MTRDKNHPAVSVVVVTYDMARELPRTLQSLAVPYQRDIGADDYEVIVVDNGSPEPVDQSLCDRFPGHIRARRASTLPHRHRRAPRTLAWRWRAPTSSGSSSTARGMASPKLLARALLAGRLAKRPIVATLAWHLGPTQHVDATDASYDRDAEDALLAEIDWTRDGYRLFGVSTLAASSSRGWFRPMGESNGLFMPRSLWEELGGLDETFVLPGGGLSNHDLFRRACELDDVQLVVLLGEGTFHQIHGGAATSGRFGWDEMHDEYVARRGRRYAPPENARLYFGEIPATTLPIVADSATCAIDARERGVI